MASLSLFQYLPIDLTHFAPKTLISSLFLAYARQLPAIELFAFAGPSVTSSTTGSFTSFQPLFDVTLLMKYLLVTLPNDLSTLPITLYFPSLVYVSPLHLYPSSKINTCDGYFIYQLG